MNFKIFYNIFCILLINFSLIVEARELSIKQLEERKKADLERKKERDKRGKKTFQKEVTIINKVAFISKERETPPVLSNLDPIIEDEGFYGVKLAIEDNLTTGRFVGHDYKAEFHRILLKEDLNSEFEKLIKKGIKFFIADLNEDELLSLMNIPEIKDVIVFNVRAKNDSLRNENCKKNFFQKPNR